MKTLPLPTADYLRECLSYDPETGILMWKERPPEHFANEGLWLRWNTRWAGKPAGGVMNHGYVTIKINAQPYLAHRIIWKWMTGEDPSDQIDHEKQDRTDNRWTKLRAATHGQNMINRHVSKASGLPKGVSRKGNRYAATARDSAGQFTYLGSYATSMEARAAYVAFVRDRHGEFFYP